MTDFTKADIMQWLDVNGRTGDPALDGLRYAAARAPIDLAVIKLDTTTADDSDDTGPRS